MAFPVGALPEIIDNGRTEFLVRDVQEMAEAIDAAAGLPPDACREAACRRFTAAGMVERYLALLWKLGRR